VHYDFGVLIDNVSSVAHFLVADKGISFRLSVPEELHICLYGDDMRLRQVLLNVLGNAIKFTEKGFVLLEISFTDDAVKIAVRDTGIGIPEKNLPTLFDAFEQADMEKNRTKQGTGLGLTIVKSIVDMMDGSITVESVYGQGTTFHIEIPRIPGDVALIQNIGGNVTEINAPDANVLVVDDNNVNLNVACGLLSLCNITAETATSGRQAIEMIRKNDYDLVFMDHRMPEMDGIEATGIIRKLGINVTIIALTASAVVGAKDMMLKAGMDDYLSKPIIHNDLLQMLKKWLPAEKLLDSDPSAAMHDDVLFGADYEFWRRIEQIEGLSLSTGLERVDGSYDVYEKALKLMVKEIEKAVQSLAGHLSANDFSSFRIKVHSIKSSLANIGAMELAAKAYYLEVASEKTDVDLCAKNLPAFLDGLNRLSERLKEAFSTIGNSDVYIEIPQELPNIFRSLTEAFREMDLRAIDLEVKKLDALNLSGVLSEKTEQIKDSIVLMDYDYAALQMRELLGGA
jgi:CheY-like chemotaxis protein/HPt (histidine-containing phosphotransfer) domain-containing protein/anti-sigma regulatory factor (Ser/Thr protein kinase)